MERSVASAILTGRACIGLDVAEVGEENGPVLMLLVGLEETGTEASASALILSNLEVMPSMILPKDWVDYSMLVRVSSVILRSF